MHALLTVCCARPEATLPGHACQEKEGAEVSTSDAHNAALPPSLCLSSCLQPRQAMLGRAQVMTVKRNLPAALEVLTEVGSGMCFVL